MKSRSNGWCRPADSVPERQLQLTRGETIMQPGKLRTFIAGLAIAAGALLLAPGSAHAVPSFARQTGFACEACHTVFPELTPYGRRFKLNAYTVDNLPQVSGMTPSKEESLVLNQLPPLSFMFQTSYTKTKGALPDTALPGELAKNGQVLFPQQASLFYAGRIAPNLGAFVQMTYDGTSGSFGWDNTDIRYARLASDNFLWGISAQQQPDGAGPVEYAPRRGSRRSTSAARLRRRRVRRR